MNHRLTPARKAFVPPTWFLVLSILSVVAAAAWAGWLVVDGRDDDGSGPTPVAYGSATPTSEPTPTPTPTPTPSEPPTPEPTRTAEPEPERTLALSVLNNTGTPGLARQRATEAQNAGWTIGFVGNWRGSVQGNTVFYPAGGEEQAELLADDLGIATTAPAYAPMNLGRLTVILAGPQ